MYTLWHISAGSYLRAVANGLDKISDFNADGNKVTRDETNIQYEKLEEWDMVFIYHEYTCL